MTPEGRDPPNNDQPDQPAGRFAGRTLGPYPVRALLGAGGMGEVYRAHDPRLGRDVAIKVLPLHLAADGDALTRFEREAKSVAALSHPNILSIYDFGTDQGVAYAVMELLDGETLRARLTEGPLPWRKAVATAVQIADGLAAAHAKGIVHRDLKPENVFLTSSGQAKILDFGLARQVAPVSGVTGVTGPTIGAVTRPGTLLGTVGYMSPEQVRGEEAGPPSDIFSFGCLLHEMVSGRAPFERQTTAETLAAVLRDDPPSLGSDAPPALETLVHHCLERRPADRFQSASDMGFALRALGGAGSIAGTAVAAPPVSGTTRAGRAWGLLVMGAALGLAVGAFGTWIGSRAVAPRASAPALAHLSFPVSDNAPLLPNDSPAAGSSMALSQDGRWIVYVTRRDGERRLVLRDLGRPEETVVAGTDGAMTPVFSPDGQWIAFFTETGLRKVPLAGGTPTTICATPPVARGATWADDGRIYFSPDFAGGIQSVAASGGLPTPVTKVEAGESNHLLPDSLPGGTALLFTVWNGGDFSQASVWAFDLRTGERKRLIESASAPRFVSPGFLVFARSGGLFATRFDVERLAVMGEAVPVFDGVWNDRATGTTHYAVARNGTAIFALGGSTVERRRLVWVDRQGRAEPIAADPSFYGNPRISPDGRHIAVEALNDLWVHALDERTLTRVTYRGVNQHPAWAPDGRHLAFSSSQGVATTGALVFWTDVQSGQQPERLTRDTKDTSVQFPTSWAPDGSALAYAALRIDQPGVLPETSDTGWDIWLLRPGGSSETSALVRTPFNEDQAMFSPDGRAFAYVSNETGQLQVYIRSLSDPGRRIRVSTDGGTEPVWTRSGGELFYRHGRQYFAVPVTTTSDPVRTGRPVLLFTGDFVVASLIPGCPSYDVAPDGRRFVMVQRADDTPRPARVEVILGWTGDLERRLPPVTAR